MLIFDIWLRAGHIREIVSRSSGDTIHTGIIHTIMSRFNNDDVMIFVYIPCNVAFNACYCNNIVIIIHFSFNKKLLALKRILSRECYDDLHKDLHHRHINCAMISSLMPLLTHRACRAKCYSNLCSVADWKRNSVYFHYFFIIQRLLYIQSSYSIATFPRYIDNCTNVYSNNCINLCHFVYKINS